MIRAIAIIASSAFFGCMAQVLVVDTTSAALAGVFGYLGGMTVELLIDMITRYYQKGQQRRAHQ